MEGGTTFHFVDDGIESALAHAQDAAGGRDVWLAGGASVVNQYLAARLVDEIDVSIALVILGAGARLFEGLGRGALMLKQIRAVDAPGVTHIKYESADPLSPGRRYQPARTAATRSARISRTSELGNLERGVGRLLRHACRAYRGAHVRRAEFRAWSEAGRGDAPKIGRVGAR